MPSIPAARREAPSQPQVEAMRRFNRFYTRKIGVLKRGLLDSGYTLTEVRVLYEIGHAERASGAEPRLTASALCEALDLDASYLSRILRAFASQGLLKREASAVDKRAAWLKLTAKGRKLFEALNRASNDDAAALLAKMPGTDADNVLAAMHQIETLLGAEAAHPSDTAKAKSSPCVLRDIRPGDLGWVIQRHGALYAQEYGWDWSFEALVARICARFVEHFDPEKENCWIAEDQSGPVGCVFVVKKSPRVAQLRMLLVEPRARGQHLGARLVDECIAFARAQGYRKLMLWTNDILHAARRIYQARGFRLIDQETHFSFGKDLVGQTWELGLGPIGVAARGQKPLPGSAK